MKNFNIKVRSSPATFKWQETEDFATPLFYLLTVSVFSTNRALLSHGGLKPNFMYNEKRKQEEPPFLKGHS